MHDMRSTPGQAPLATEAGTFWPSGDPLAPPLWIAEGRPWTTRMVDYYLDRYSAPGDLVVDPFATQPALARIAATSQRRILLNHYSPAALLTLHTSADPPPPSAIDAAFSAVADAPRRGRTLADYLQSLYESICPECAQTLAAAHFIWDRNAGEPVAKGYTCPHCGNSGQAATDLADSNLAASLEVRGAAYWGLLSRLVAPGDPQTTEARALLELYTPRALIAISELLAAVEQRLKDPTERRAGQALVLHVIQRCLSQAVESGATAEPVALLLPDKLQLPARFVEHNAWLALESAYRLLRQRPSSPVRQSADLTALQSSRGPGSALLLSWSLQGLAQQLEPDSVALAISDPPRLAPSQYPLSFLWSGWLFGRKAASHLKTMLTVEAAGWDWYARVMAAALRSVRRLLKPDGHLVLACSGSSARLPLALLNAASYAGLRLVAQATQAPLLPDDGELSWRLAFTLLGPAQVVSVAGPLDHQLRQAAQAAVHDLAHLRGEPAPAPLVNTAIGVRWAEDALLGNTDDDNERGRKPITFLVQQSRLALGPELAPLGLRYVEGAADNPAPQWALESPANQPLADRVELAIVDLLAQGEQPTHAVFDQIYTRFPGWLTPDTALIHACLDSYSQVQASSARLRPEDEAANRARERGEMLLRLHDLGHRLGYQVWVAPVEQAAAMGLVPLGQKGPVDGEQWAPAGLVWHETGQPAQAFALSAHALLHPWLAQPPETLGGCPRYVVLPGGRAGLLAFKLRRTPAWRNRLAENGWEFVKFRHVRQLAGLPDLTRASFRARIGLDPAVTLPGAQLTLFDIPTQGDTDAD